MTAPTEPLEWPKHFPPTDPVKKFFIGVRWLGPDLQFFKELEVQQASRTQTNMRNWTTDKERSVATLMGKHFRDYIGWRTETFLPNDRFQVIAYGPRFQSFDELLFEEAILGIEAEMGLKFPDSFWTQLFDSTFGDVVHAVIQEANQVMHPFEYK